MTKFKYEGDCGVLAKRIMFLAWQGCGGPLGMGIFQDRGPGVTEDEVWEGMYNKVDYPGKNTISPNQPKSVYADYVFGRMMKFSVKWDFGEIELSDNYDREYQSFCRKYPNAESLFQAAVKSLEQEATK